MPSCDSQAAATLWQAVGRRVFDAEYVNQRARDIRSQTSVWHDRKELSAGCEEDTEGARSMRSHAARLCLLFVAGIAASAAAIDEVISSCINKRCNSDSGASDAVKVFTFGFSMGGHMALQMAGQLLLLSGSA